MKNKSESRSQTHQMFAFLILIISFTQVTIADQSHGPEILIKGPPSNSTNGAVPKILKLAPNGHPEVVHATEIIGEPLFTLKSDPVRVQSDFKTVDISVLNKQRDTENAKKVAILQEDLQSRIKIDEAEEKSEEPQVEGITEADREEVIQKQAKVKEDIESRVLTDDGLLGFIQESGREEKLHFPVKRSDEDYYADEPEIPQARMTTEAPKEEESFFSIFESLFGSSDDESQTKKKAQPEDEPMFKEDSEIKENIKAVGNILKPLKPIDKPESGTQNTYQNSVPEYRIVNNFHSSQSHKQSYKQPETKHPYHSFYRPTERPYRPYKPYSTNGYEDYDLEEFMDKGDSTTRVKYVSPAMTTLSTVKYPTTTTTTTVTTTTVRTTPKSTYDNKLKFPSIQKKNDYINRNKYQEVTEKATERVTYQKPEIKTTTEVHHVSRPNHENKDVEIKTQKIQESPNFYNLINLPVRYSTKDTAIPLISTSYANTKIQGMGAHKYEKGANGKYPNHKYDQVTSSTTKRPNYWATKRTSTERTTTSFRPSPMIPKTTTKYDLDKVEYDDMPIGMGPALGNYGSKTGVEVKTQTPVRQTSTTAYRETTTKTDYITPESSQSLFRQNATQQEKLPEKTSPRPVYEEYEYETFPENEHEAKPSQNYPHNYLNKQQQTELEYKTQYQTIKRQPETPRPTEVVEYEYYDYDVDPSTTTTLRTTTTSTTTSKYKVKYPNLSKDKIKTSSSEKVAVVVPSKDHDFYNENQSQTVTSTVFIPSTTTTTSTAPPKPPQTTTTEAKTTENEIEQFRKTTPHYYKPNQVYKEPAPVFEDVKEDYTTKQVTTTTTTTKKVSENTPTTSTTTVKPVIVTSSNREQETNANIVLVPTKETVKTEEKFSQPEPPVQKPNAKPGYDYTTEFTVGVVHGGASHGLGKNPSGQGHFVASSISTNPYGDDEPFRPIPKPPGLTSNFQLVHEEAQGQPSKNTPTFQKRPTPPSLEETEPIHEPHEFIPSPQFHRPAEPKPPVPGTRPGTDVDYDFEGIQTEPKPGQYVIFSKPQLNPEMNENQHKKKPQISSPTKPVSNVPHYHEKVNPYWQENQKHVVFNPSEGQIYQSVGKPKPSNVEKLEGRPVFGNPPNEDQLPLQLVPPRGDQPEKPFEGNFVLPEEKQESTVSYPRPHWEKNSKPSFLMNTFSNKNDIVGNRHPSMPHQMAPTLIPPSSIPPQRFRRPVQPPHMPPMRKNFNEASTNVKPKPNLPNILPQFRPNTKVGSGPYHRPPGYHGSNRRNGMNRYHDKEHGSFPYHIQHPDKDAPFHREFDMEPEIIPKFITNRGKLPSEVWNSQGVQKRFGQGPPNVHSGETPQRVLRRHQRTPVTTLQMLKQRQGVKTQKIQVSREDGADSSVPLLPPVYKTYVDQPTTNENVYIVYPAKAPQKLHTDDTKVFIVSDTKSRKNFYNLTKTENQHPLISLNRKGNDKPKNTFPYGFEKPVDRLPVKRNDDVENEEKFEKNDDQEQISHKQKILPAPAPSKKDEKIDMLLHLQSNNQWNEVKTPPDSMVSVRNPPEIIRHDHYRFSDYTSKENGEIQLNPPSEYHTNIKDDSAFTLGAVMHTMSEGSRKGQVASIPLHSDDEEVNIPKLNVNERISNGKIVTVSMPLDVKQDPNEKETQYQFQAPFQPSSSLTSNESHPVSQGWSIVKNPEDDSESEDGKKTTEASTNPGFNFENFKPELIGGFKPIFELPEEPEETQKEEKAIEREEKKDSAR